MVIVVVEVVVVVVVVVEVIKQLWILEVMGRMLKRLNKKVIDKNCRPQLDNPILIILLQ